MDTNKCSKCGLINWSSETFCKRCHSSLDKGQNECVFENTGNNRKTAFSANPGAEVTAVTGDVKKMRGKKIKWGSIIAFAGFALLFGAIYFGMSDNLNLANGRSKKLVGIVSIFTLLPSAAIIAGFIELMTGVSIFEIIEKWEQLPQWLGWLIGFAVFFLIIFVIIIVAAVVIVNFF